MDLKGRVVWVVGASSGIGAELAKELVRRGSSVAISARREDHLHEVAQGKMLVVPADVTDLPSLEKANNHIKDTLGALDIVVISAGYWKRMSGKTWSTQTFNDHININLIGTSNVISVVLPDMIERNSGLLAGVASVAGFRGLPGSEAYGATKAAQINLLEALRIRVASRNVRVTTICPGFVRTELTAENTFPMPFIIDADRAARDICDGLEKDRPVIVFPKQMAFLMNVAKYVPARIWARLFARQMKGR